MLLSLKRIMCFLIRKRRRHKEYQIEVMKKRISGMGPEEKERFKMLRKLKMYLLAAALLMLMVFISEGRPSKAATVIPSLHNGSIEIGNEVEDEEHQKWEKTIEPSTDSTEGSSDVPEELQKAAERTNTLIDYVCSWVGGIMAIFGFIWAAMNQAGHNPDQRNMGIILAVVGIVVVFAPQIVRWIIG